MLCVALASVSAFAYDANAGGNYALDLSVAFAPDPLRVSYAWAPGSFDVDVNHSGISNIGGSSSYSWPTFGDPTLGTSSGNVLTAASPVGGAYAKLGIADFDITFTNNSNRQRAVAFEADFSDSLYASITNPATQSSWAKASYSIFDSSNLEVLGRLDQVTGAVTPASASNSFSDSYDFFLAANTSETFHVYSKVEAESTAGPVPEPMSLGILGIGIAGLVRLRKKS